MQCPTQILVKMYILIHTATWGECWQYFTPLNEIKMYHSSPDKMHIHSEYHFGKCVDNKDKIFYTHVHLDRTDVLGKIFVRGWIIVPRIPTCIVLRAYSYDLDMIQSTTYNFQMCVPRITYCHSHRRVKLFYYEWYIPKDMSGGMDWDIYFFGPSKLTWQ